MKSQLRALFVVAVIAVAGMAVAVYSDRVSVAAARPATKPNIIMVVVDTLRADRLGSYGNPRGLTPFLDQLAARGTRFTAAYASSSWTCPSIASLFTSRYPTQHGVIGFDSPLSVAERTLAEALADAGYRSGGFSANFRLTSELGYAQGFGAWRTYFPARNDKGETPAKMRGGHLREEAASFVTSTRAFREPYFLYFQLMETHAPYDPPAPFRQRFAPPSDIDDAATMTQLLQRVWGMKRLNGAQLARLQQLYDGEVAAADDELRQLFERLEALGMLHDAIIIITADHGEEFGEHGELLHGMTLYEPAIRVPLLVVGRGVPAGHIVRQPVSLLDVAPSVLELAGLRNEPSFQGRSLVPMLGGANVPRPHGVVSELERVSDHGLDPRQHARALIEGANKAMLTPRGGLESYDLAHDPGERESLIGSRAVEVASSFAPLAAEHAVLATLPRAEPQREAAVLDDATKEKLRALGYHQ